MGWPAQGGCCRVCGEPLLAVEGFLSEDIVWRQVASWTSDPPQVLWALETPEGGWHVESTKDRTGDPKPTPKKTQGKGRLVCCTKIPPRVRDALWDAATGRGTKLLAVLPGSDSVEVLKLLMVLPSTSAELSGRLGWPLGRVRVALSELSDDGEATRAADGTWRAELGEVPRGSSDV